MIVAATAIAVILNGALIPASHPARLVAGHIVVPLVPVVNRIVRIADIEPDRAIVTLIREPHRMVFRLGSFDATLDGVTTHVDAAPFRERDTIFVPLAPVIRAFGGSIVFDARAKTVAISVSADEAPIATMTPFDPRTTPSAVPSRAPTAPPTASPRPVESGSPRPRRTPIPGGSL